MSDTCDKNLAIIGLGLLGASIGMALNNKKFHRVGWDQNEKICNQALKDKVIDSTDKSLSTVLKDADLVIFCLPVTEMIIYTWMNRSME